jgi:hypothetical protein
MFIGFILSNIGHIRPHRTILAFVSGIFFILSGKFCCFLFMHTGLLMFNSCTAVLKVLVAAVGQHLALNTGQAELVTGRTESGLEKTSHGLGAHPQPSRRVTEAPESGWLDRLTLAELG